MCYTNRRLLYFSLVVNIIYILLLTLELLIDNNLLFNNIDSAWSYISLSPKMCHVCLQEHTHTHNRFTALWILSGTTRVSRYQKKHSPISSGDENSMEQLAYQGSSRKWLLNHSAVTALWHIMELVTALHHVSFFWATHTTKHCWKNSYFTPFTCDYILHNFKTPSQSACPDCSYPEKNSFIHLDSHQA